MASILNDGSRGVIRLLVIHRAQSPIGLANAGESLTSRLGRGGARQFARGLGRLSCPTAEVRDAAGLYETDSNVESEDPERASPRSARREPRAPAALLRDGFRPRSQDR